MKLKIKIVVTLLFTLLYGEVTAKIIFEEYSHDFGEIAEDGGLVEKIFRFRNNSKEPVVIVATHTSCGCTKTEFSRKPVMPDSTATVKVIFNPMNYPGAFARKITIVTTNGALDDRLLITGVVRPRVKSMEERYPIIMGEGIRVATNAHSFGFLEHGKAKQSAFELYNNSSRAVAIRIENEFPELELYYPERIEPGESVSVNFVAMLPENSTKYGSLSYTIKVVLNGNSAHYPFIINGLAIDYRGKNANNCPQMIALSENFIKFGAVKCSDVKSVRKIEIRNEGSAPLMLRKLELNSEGFTAKLRGDCTIEKGDKRVVEIEIEPSRLPFGAVVEKLRIVSNDPKMPVATIRVTAIVER